MKEIRNLLLDCRAALRKAVPEFGETPLGDRLDATIIELGQATDQQQVQAMARVQAPQEKPVAHRVAYAWQVVVRDLRKTQPELYQHLWEEVLGLLDVAVLDDPAIEIADLQARLATTEQALVGATTELVGLRAAPMKAAQPGTRAATRLAEADEPAFPTREELQAVAAGTRKFDKDELECCIGEALVRTEFQRTPVQLLEQGESGLARLLLESAPAAG